jgi:predicted DNA-binding transcriptional regulator AlpA
VQHEYGFLVNVPVLVDTPAYLSSLLVQSNRTSFRRNQMELLGAKQVSEMTGVPVGTLRYWRHSDIGPASFTLGRRVVYRRDEVSRWISQRENATRRGGGDAA